MRSTDHPRELWPTSVRDWVLAGCLGIAVYGLIVAVLLVGIAL